MKKDGIFVSLFGKTNQSDQIEKVCIEQKSCGWVGFTKFIDCSKFLGGCSLILKENTTEFIDAKAFIQLIYPNDFHAKSLNLI